MPAVTAYTSVASLVISLAALSVAVVVAVRNARLTTAQIRTELLTKLFYVRVDYSRFNRRIRELKENPPSPLSCELQGLLDAESDFQKFEQATEAYRRALLGPKRNLDSRTLLILRHHTETMAKQSEDDNKRLDEILARVGKVSKPN